MDQISTEDVEQTSAPELPSGQIPVQAPPDRAEPTGMGSILATVIPMMGSMGVMVFMAMSQGQNTRMLLMGGGMIVAEGRPEDIVKVKASYTGKFLQPLLEENFERGTK